MPRPEDPALLKLSDELVDTMRATFKPPLKHRPVHAKGQLVKGTFTPSKDVAKLSKAPIFANSSTSLITRYSTEAGLKDLPDNGEHGSRGFALRFVLSEDGHKHYNIITNNAFGFVVSTGEAFLDQFEAMRDNMMEDFLDEYPDARYFMYNQSSAHAYLLATEQRHSIHAFKFINAEGQERFSGWRSCHGRGERNIRMEIQQMDDSTKVWPETNEFAEMGEIVIDQLWSMKEGNPAGQDQRRIMDNPVPRYIDGIDVSDDPLMKVRTAMYLISGRIRREHLDQDAQQAVR